jgi:type I restriction enzyme S subunit
MKEGWEQKRIDEVCSIARGGSPRPIKDYITNDPNGLNWIKIGDTDMGGKYIYSTKEKIKPEGLKKSRWVEEDEFLLSNSMSFGRPYILKTNGCIHDGWLVLRDYQKYLNIDFFYYVLSSENVQRQFRIKAQGSTVSNLNTDRVASVIISVPPLSEQQSIVDYLDSAFAKIDAMKANAEKALIDSKALFQASLKEMLEPKEGWEKDELVKVFNFIDYRGATPTKLDRGVPLITAKNVKYGFIDYTIKDFISKEEYDNRKSRGISHKGDILFTTEAPLGNVAIADLDEFSAGQRLITLQQYEKTRYSFINKFYYYYMLGPSFQKRIKELATGATALGIKAKLLKTVVVPIPPFSEQQIIVNVLDSLKSKVDKLQENYDKISQECDALKQAILRQVFE